MKLPTPDRYLKGLPKRSLQTETIPGAGSEGGSSGEIIYGFYDDKRHTLPYTGNA